MKLNKSNENSFIDFNKIKPQKINKLDELISDQKSGVKIDKIFERIQVNFLEKDLNRSQLFFGNLALDLTDPIIEGNFTTLKCLNKDQTFQIINNLYTNNSQKKIIYFSINNIHLEEFKKINSSIEFLSCNKKKNDVYIGLRILLNYLKFLKDQSEQTILFLDDIEDLFSVCYNILRHDKSDFIFNIIRELFILTGRQKQSNLSTFIVRKEKLISTDTIKIDFIPFKKELDLLSSNTLDFTQFNKDLIFYRLKINQTQFLNFSKLQRYVQSKIAKILVKIKNEEEIDGKMTEFGVKRENWENFILMDAKYYLPILQTKKSMALEEQLLLSNFVIYLIDKDLIGYFDLEPEDLINQFFEYIQKDQSFLDDKTSLEYLQFILKQDQEIENIINSLNYQNETFFHKLKIEGRILDFKKDYLD